MSIDWKEVEKITKSKSYPPFLKLEGLQGNVKIIVTAPLRMIKGKYGKQLVITAMFNDKLYSWTMPKKVIKALKLERLKQIAEEHRIFIIQLAWLGSGKERRYQVLEISDINEIPEKEAVEIGKKIAELIKQYDGLMELLEKSGE